ncbi:Os01g0239150, partial [Oryza sativa Japonica Group]
MGTTRVEGRCSRTSRTRGRLPLEPFFPYLIIDCAFLGITKDLKGLGDLLELGLGLLLVVGGVLVGVPPHGELVVGLLEVVVPGAAVDAEDLVVVDPHLP